MLSKFPHFKTSCLFVCILLALCIKTFSQNIEGVNARLDAMAGIAAADDIGWTISHPASIYKFPNIFHGSICLMSLPGCDRTFGAIIGIVKFSEFLYAGLTFNNRLVMPASFYSEGQMFTKFLLDDGEDYCKTYAEIPQVNLCLKINNSLQFGIGGYFEGKNYSHKLIKLDPYATAVGDSDVVRYTEEHANKRVRNIGFNVEARITLGNFTIYPQFAMGFPRISGTETYDELSNAKTKLQQTPASAPLPNQFRDLSLTYESPHGLVLRGASYFLTDIQNSSWIAGLIYTNKRYQFKKITDDLAQTLDANGGVLTTVRDTFYDSISSDRNWRAIECFIGCITSFSDNLHISPEWDGGIGIFDAKDPDMPQDTNFLSMYHNFRLGMEKVVDGFWIFDEVAFRCGMMAQWNKEWRSLII